MLGRAASLMKTSHKHDGIAQETSWILAYLFFRTYLFRLITFFCPHIVWMWFPFLSLFLSLFHLISLYVSFCLALYLAFYLVILLDFRDILDPPLDSILDHPLPNALWSCKFVVFIYYVKPITVKLKVECQILIHMGNAFYKTLYVCINQTSPQLSQK